MPQRDLERPGTPLRPREDRLYVGQLLEHGAARHEFHPQGPQSYFVKLKTEQGVQTLWGKGLERAFAESKTKPQLSDIIGIRENNLDPVTFVQRKHVDGVVVAERKVDTPRPHWVVEKLEEFDRRAFGARTLRDPTIARRDAVINQPDLLPYYWVLDAFQKVGERDIENPRGRDRFMGLARAALSLAYERAEPPPLPAGESEKAQRLIEDLERKKAEAASRPRVPE